MKVRLYTFSLITGLLFISRTVCAQADIPTFNKLLDIKGAASSYLFNYRSAIDTPYTERNILQNNLTGSIDAIISGKMPLRISYWGRYSNSGIYKNITDVQVSLDQHGLRNILQQDVRRKLEIAFNKLKDSLLEKSYGIKKQQLDSMLSWLGSPLYYQKLIEANEIIKVPYITYNSSVPDSINQQAALRLKKEAAAFIELYNKTKGEYDKLSKEVDSLKTVYNDNRAKMDKLRNQLESGNITAMPGKELESFVPPGYKWLSGIRKLGIGRVPVSQSMLTANTISVRGIDFVYNSWYYLAVTAGLVDYRFRDYTVPAGIKPPQYIYMVRAGIGRLEQNYFIVSAYKGRKQIFGNSASGNGINAINVTGYSAEAKLNLNRNIYVIGEVAESISPNYFDSSFKKPAYFNLSDKSNKAIAIQIHGNFPGTGTRLEGMYKYTGVNFQSFSSTQLNSSLRAWSIQGEQYLADKQVKVSAGLKKNDFENPFIYRSYSSNTVFKSLAATVKISKWPVIYLGYLPLSQVLFRNDQMIETRFQSLNINVLHSYKVTNVSLTSSLAANRFYNTGEDSGFVYYNAVNVLLSQSLFFDFLSTTLSLSHTQNNNSRLNVLDQSIQIPINKRLTGGGGIKLNRMDADNTKIGSYLNASVRIGKQDVIYINYERGYIPRFTGGLIRNDWVTLQFTKNVQFR